MARVLSSIFLDWDNNGNISHRITGGYSDIYKDKVQILAPSLPMIFCHQLGVYLPSNGLILCSVVFDYYLNNKHIRQSINPAFKSARMDFVETEAGVRITFWPKMGFLADSYSQEEGSRQLLSNYLAYVTNQLTGDTWIIVKAFVCTAVEGYIDILNELLKQKWIGLALDKWNKVIASNMTVYEDTIAEQYGPEFPKDADREKVLELQNRKLLEIQIEFTKLCKDVGL